MKPAKTRANSRFAEFAGDDAGRQVCGGTSVIPRSYKKLSPHCSLDLAGSEEVIIVPEPPISDLSKTGLFTVLAANTGHIPTTVSSQHFRNV